MKALTCALVFILVGCASNPSVQTGIEGEVPARKLREQALQNYQKGHYLSALQSFQAAQILEAENTEPRYLLVEYYCAMAVGLYPRALTIAEQLVRLSPFQALSYQNVGIAQLWLQKYDRALTSFLKGLEFDSRPPKLHFYLGLTYDKLKKAKKRDESFAKAEDEYLHILEENPKDFAANFELASLYLFSNQKIDKVESLIKAAKSADPEEDLELLEGAKIYSQFYIPTLEGIFLYRQGKASEAIEALKTALENSIPGMKADLAEVFYYLAESKKSLSDLTAHQSLLEQVTFLDPTGPFVKTN